MLATYIGKENLACDLPEVCGILLVPNREYNIYIHDLYEESGLEMAYVYIFNKKGKKLRGRILYDTLSEVRNNWKLFEKNDSLISQSLTTFA